jgi:tetratricopeptide (TPR) repeat protein
LVPDLPAPIDVGPEQAQARLFEALSQLALGLAEGLHPVLLCLDDVHWADGTTLEWLVYLGRRLHGSRVLVVGTYRCEEADAVSGLRRGLARLGILVDLNLTALTAADVLELLHHLDGDEYDASAVADRLQRTTGGNPFFLMETLRALIEAGQKPEDLVGVKDLPISETVRETVTVRLGRLAPVARQVLEAGAVLGPLFRFEVVRRTAGRGEMEALDGLDELLDRQVLEEQDSGYQFQHEIIRTVVYGNLSYGRRRLLHRRAGEALEREVRGQAAAMTRSGAPPAKPEWVRRHAERDRMAGIAAQLARHFQEAGIAEKAIEYWKQAGDAAAAVYANEEAIVHYSRALALMPEDDLAARCALLLDRERVYNLLGDRDAQSGDLGVLQTLAEELGDPGTRAEVAWRQATWAEAIGDYPLAIAAAEQAVALSREAGEEQCVVDGHLAWGQALERQGNYDLARDHWAEALELASAAGLTHSASKSLHALALLEWNRGDYAAAQSFLAQGLAIIRETGDLQAETDQLNLLGLLYEAVGDYAAARVTLQQVIEICHEIGNRLIEGYAHNNLGMIDNHLGAYQEARKHHESSLAMFTEIGSLMGQGGAFENLGATARDQGDYHAARAHYERSLAIFREIGNRPFEGYPLTGLGDALAGLGELTEAATAYQQAVALRRELGLQGMALVSQTGMARVALAQGDLVQAQSHVDPILEFLDAGRGPELSLMEQIRYLYLTSYQVLKASQNPRAEEILETAYQLLQEKAANILDEETRRVFLEDIAWHRQIVSWYEPASEEG